MMMIMTIMMIIIIIMMILMKILMKIPKEEIMVVGAEIKEITVAVAIKDRVIKDRAIRKDREIEIEAKDKPTKEDALSQFRLC